MPIYPPLSRIFPDVSPRFDPVSISAAVFTTMFSFLSPDDQCQFRTTAAQSQKWTTMLTFLAEGLAKEKQQLSPWAVMPDRKLAIAIRSDSIPIFAVNLGSTLTIKTFLNKNGTLDWVADGVLVDAKFRFPSDIYGLRRLNNFYLTTQNLKAGPVWSNIYPADGQLCTGPGWPKLSAPLTEQWEFILHKNPWGTDLKPGVTYEYAPTMSGLPILGLLSSRNILGLPANTDPLPVLKNLWEKVTKADLAANENDDEDEDEDDEDDAGNEN